MYVSNNLAAIEDCQACKQRGESAFCRLPMDCLRVFDQISYAVRYPEHAVLFMEGQPCQAVFVLCSGRAKLTTASRDSRTVMLRIAAAGEVLGLSAVLTATDYDVSAETLAPAVVRVCRREDFVHFLHSFPVTNFQALGTLSHEYEIALDSVRSLAWLPTASARVAQLLLQLCSKDPRPQREARAKLILTQEQIAQMTATTRETVTRLFSQLRREHVISIRGSDLIIRNRAALEQLAS